MTNFVKSGDHLTLAAPYDVLSGGGFKVGNVFGVAANDTLSGADVECNVEGVYDLAKDNSTFSQGDLAYWDDSAKKVTSTVASNLLIGAVEVAAATSVAIVRVNLFGVPGFSGQAHGLKVAHALYDYAVDGGAGRGGHFDRADQQVAADRGRHLLRRVVPVGQIALRKDAGILSQVVDALDLALDVVARERIVGGHTEDVAHLEAAPG